MGRWQLDLKVLTLSPGQTQLENKDVIIQFSVYSKSLGQENDARIYEDPKKKTTVILPAPRIQCA